MNKLLRPRFISFLIILLFSVQLTNAQEVIHCWDFNGTVPFSSPVDSDNRVSGDGTITHNFLSGTALSSTGTTLNECGTSNPGTALSIEAGASTANNNRYLDLSFQTTGFNEINLSLAQRSEVGGFIGATLSYSLDGGTSFTNFQDPFGNNLTYGSSSSFQVRNLDLSSSSSGVVNNQSSLIIRLTFIGANTDSAAHKIDNLKLEGTPINTNDMDSQIVSPSNQITGNTIIAADVTSLANAAPVFSFGIEDQGTADNLPTNVTKLRFRQGGSNTLQPSAIQALRLRDIAENEIISGDFSLSQTEIVFEPDQGTFIEIPNSETKDYVVELVLNESPITDGDIVQFRTSTSSFNFEADPNGSQFADTFPAEVLGEQFPIDVVATDIAFLQQPTDVDIMSPIQPAVEVEFVDANGNRDLDVTDAVEITSSGDLVNEPVSVGAINGVATFSDLVHSTAGIGLDLKADTADPFSVTSDSFNVFANDETSEVVAPWTQIPNSTIVAANSTSTPTPVFNFVITDPGTADNLPTEVNEMRFVGGTNNTADWSTTFSQVIINGASGEIDGTYAVSENEIIFTPDEPVIVDDSSTSEFSIEVVLNETGITDQSIIQLQVDGENSGFTAELTGSQFSSNFSAGDIVGNDISIDVVATDIAFLQQPTDVNILVSMQPDVEVEFVDANGNRDLDVTDAVEIISSGDLVNEPVSVGAIDGVATFSDLVHSTAGTGLELTATEDSFSLTSDSFDVFANDETSEVVAPGTQIGTSTIVAANSTSTPTPVFNFDITDPGTADNLPTEVKQMRFVGGTNNTADWSTTFSQVIINGASGEIDGTYAVSENEIIFTPDEPVIVDDSSTSEFSIEVVLNETGITDQSIIQLQVDAENSGFTAEPTGSQFSSNFSAGDVAGSEITIDVEATEIRFLQQPTDVEVNAFITPAVLIGFVDANGNVDISQNSNVSLGSNNDGIAINLPRFVSPVNGIATVADIAFSEAVTGVFIQASTFGFPNVLSSSFDVGTPVIAIQDFDGTQPEWNYTTSTPEFDNGWDVGGFFGEISSADALPLSSGSFVENIFGVNNLSGTETLDFVTVDVSGYTDVNLSFDWEAIGNASSTESITYQIFVDGVPQVAVDLYTGDGTTLSGSGAVSEVIPSGTQDVSLVVTVQDNGVDSYIGLDNFRLTGDSNARDTDIIASDPQIPAGTLIADVNDELAEAVEVFSFEVVDSGNFDDLPTTITQLRFVAGTANTADWSNEIQGISISDGTNTLLQSNQDVTINPNEILVDITGDPDTMFEVADGDSKEYTISVFLNGGGITDGEVIQLAIAEGNQGQLASSDGSIFSNDITAFEGNEFLIDVIGNGLEFVVQPSTTVAGVIMDPDVEVANTDGNGNFDTDGDIEITSSGTLSQSPNSSGFGQNGLANFNTIRHTQPGFDLILTAELVRPGNTLTSVDSDLFDITQNPTLLISEVVDPSDDPDGRYVELFNIDVEPLDLSDQSYFLINPTSGESEQLTGTIPPKSYYVISFTDATTFNSLYGRDPNFEAPAGLASDGMDAYVLSFDESDTRAVMDIYGIESESGTSSTSWEFTDARAFRNIPSVRAANPGYTVSEWTLESASTTDATIGIGDNDFVYSNDTDNWSLVGIGTPPGGSANESIFIEAGTATLSASTTISDVVVRDGATLIIEDLITLNGDFANFTTSGNGKVTFRSTATKTGVLGEFDAENRKLVGDNYEIQRYIPESNRAHRYLSPSVTTTSPIRDHWQEGTNNTETGDANNSNPNPGFGTHITGSEIGANGFDATLTGNPSMFEWSASNQQWNPIPNTNSKTFNAGEAYSLLFRGDRSTTLNSNDAVGPSTTLRTTGRLVVGSRGVNNVSSVEGEFSLIGNPYQARVNMETLLASGNATGVNSSYVYIFDPTLGNTGAYATVELNSGDAFEDDFTTPSSSDASNILEPNQAFFVETINSAASPAVIFDESFKASQGGGNVAFSLPKEQQSNLSVNLFFDKLDTKPVDAVKVKFRAGGNNAKDNSDAQKIWNYNESLAINRNPNYMSIETRAMPSEQDSVPLFFGYSRRSSYRFEIQPKNLTSVKAYLFDKYLETEIELPSDKSTSYSFEFDNSIKASKATDRFVIKFEEVTLGDDDFDLNSSLVVYPNPVRGERFTISHQQAFEADKLDLKVFDLQGRLIMDQKIENAPRVEVDIDSNLSSGVYILKLTDGKASQSVKLIVE